MITGWSALQSIQVVSLVLQQLQDPGIEFSAGFTGLGFGSALSWGMVVRNKITSEHRSMYLGNINVHLLRIIVLLYVALVIGCTRRWSASRMQII